MSLSDQVHLTSSDHDLLTLWQRQGNVGNGTYNVVGTVHKLCREEGKRGGGAKIPPYFFKNVRNHNFFNKNEKADPKMCVHHTPKGVFAKLSPSPNSS